MDFRDISPQIAEVAKGYDYQKPPDMLVLLQELVDRVLRFINDLLASLHIFVPGLADTSMVGNVMQLLLYVVGAICVGGLIFAVWSRMRHLRLQSQLARKGQTASEALLDARGWRIEAGKLSQSGLHKEACRALYLSLLRLLDESGALEYTPTRTNYEYWYALKNFQPLANCFKKIAVEVEAVWFGNGEANADIYTKCLCWLDEAEADIKGELEKGTIKPRA